MTFLKPLSFSFLTTDSHRKHKYRHIIPETGTGLGSSPDMCGYEAYLELTAHTSD